MDANDAQRRKIMNKLLSIWKKHREIIMYLVVGGATTLVNIIVYMMLSHTGFGTVSADFDAWLVTVIFAYVTNRIFVFRSDKRSFSGILKELLSFFAGRTATGIIDIAIMVICVDMLLFNELVMKIIANAIVIILNFVISKLWVFKKNIREID